MEISTNHMESEISVAKMIDIQNSKGRNYEKPFPGCLGRMVNLLDLGTGMGGNKLLTTKPHCDGDQLGSTLSRSRSDVARMSRSIGDTVDDKLIVSDLRISSNMKLNRTPIKMLIAQEMSNDLKSNHNPPSVVAKLMGLDNLPQQRQSDSVSQRSHSRSYSTSTLTHAGRQRDFWQHENNFLEERVQREAHQCSEQTEYKDVYEILQQSQRSNSTRDTSPRKGINHKDTYEKKMALVRQKFTEAKSLATDEKLRQSKEFQDALEVLSANRDLFIKFLQEPNALFSKHKYDFDFIPPSPGTKCITVLKPSMMLDNDKVSRSAKKSETQTRKPYQKGTVNDSHLNNDIPCPPTRIVVLKPSPCDTHEYKSVASPYSSSPRTVHGDSFCDEVEDDEVRESRDVAKEITQQVCENLSGDHSDETVLSSVCSNGYIGDESSFHKSETEYAVENLSDSEVITPTSRHSWDYINRFNTSFPPSSTRTSCSPESSVCREAKKRLSERWAMLALNRNSHEQIHVRRSFSTLGEMLALSETPKSANHEDEEINKDEESRAVSCLSSNLNKEGMDDDDSRNFSRSKSVPIFLTEHSVSGNGQLAEFPDRKELTKVKSLKSSFKGKVSSLFFSRNKNSNKNKSQSTGESQATTSEPPVTLLHNLIYGDDVTQRVNESNIKESLAPCLHPSSKGAFGTELRQGIATEKGTSENSSENQDQPSPISVLEPHFQEDDNTSPVSSGTKNSMISSQSNLIGKSPRIGSIARTLSWQDDPITVITSPLKPEKEQDWRVLIQSLLSLAGLDGNMSSESLIGRWHSSKSALDPNLREKYVEMDHTMFVQDSNHRRQLRSSRKLVFDCVNAALLDLTTYDVSSPILVDKVWSWMKASSYDELKCNLSDDEDGNDLIVELVVRKEVVGKMWSDRLALERENVEGEIEKKLIEELVEESLVELYR